jgi:probable HAF family extracellular repeat protein
MAGCFSSTLQEGSAMKHWFCGLIALGLCLGMAGQSKGQATYSFTTLDVPGALGNNTPTGINDSGQIVGWYDDTERHGFLLDQGIFTIVPDSTRAQAFGINNAGQIVGNGGEGPGFLFDHGSYTILGLDLDLVDPYMNFNGINASGQIVGWYRDVDSGVSHSFLFDHGSYTTFDVPGGTVTRAYGINDSGQVVGAYTDAAGNGYGFLLENGTYTTLDFVPSGINELGQIVGGNLLFDHGNYTTLDVPGSTWTEANGINNLGQIVGYYRDANGGAHGFLATPVP